MKMANILLGKEAEAKFLVILLSNDTISGRINNMSGDILAQIVADLISSPVKFSLQLDESTDVSNMYMPTCCIRALRERQGNNGRVIIL